LNLFQSPSLGYIRKQIHLFLDIDSSSIKTNSKLRGEYRVKQSHVIQLYMN
jgi:hypothetical protein